MKVLNVNARSPFYSLSNSTLFWSRIQSAFKNPSYYTDFTIWLGKVAKNN